MGKITSSVGFGCVPSACLLLYEHGAPGSAWETAAVDESETWDDASTSSMADVVAGDDDDLPWCIDDSMLMCHWLAMDTILCALCVILAAPSRHMKKPLSCTAEPTCTSARSSSLRGAFVLE